MNEVVRQEKKYLISVEQYYSLSAQFAQVMAMDSHSKGEGYGIRSLYFDTIDDRDFHEKADGVEIRRKFRLRTYGPDTPFAMMEIKQKEGNYQKKRSLRVSREDAQEICAGRYGALLKYPDSMAAECYALMNMHCYQPKVVVEYKRKAFVAKENRTRVTFDHHITSTESCYDLFSPELSLNSVLNQNMVILEVKYNGFLLSPIKDMLRAVDVAQLAAGKYNMGRGVTKHYRF